jgi:transposase-like protein
MDWPRTPVEQIPHHRFHPPHCPWPRCPQHRIHAGFLYIRFGFFSRAGDARRVQRFRCLLCRRTFSQQTFAASYYAKLPRLAPRVAAGLVAGSAHRQLARSESCAPSTVTRLAARLGRHALLLHARALRHLDPLDETIVADHFETFAGSQLDALGLATPVGHDSWFVYGLEPAPHRRGGRLTPAQKRRLARRKRPRPPKGQLRRSFSHMLDRLLELRHPDRPLRLFADGNPAYPAAVKHHPRADRIDFRAFPNPKRGPKGSPRSPEARRRDAAMAPVDHLHRLLRHSQAHHRRETIAFARRINGALERGFLTLVWRNLVKRRREQITHDSTPAMRLGLVRERWSWDRVLAQRLFVERESLPPPWRKVYRRDWDDDDDARSFTRHRAKHAA